MKYEEPLDEMGRWLLLAVRGERSGAESGELRALYRRLGEAACIEAARRNQVEALAASALAEMLPAGELPEPWSNLLRANEARVRELLEALRAVVARLEAIPCRSALIESGGVMLGSGLSFRGFCSGDFDLLVERAHWERVRRSFEAEGFREADRRERPTNRIEFKREKPGRPAQWLNACYTPFDRMWVPLPYTDRSALWLERRVASRRAPGLFVLAPPDALACVALHTSLHSYVRAPGVRLHVDVDRLARDNAVAWDLFVEEVRALGVPTRVFVSLAMAAGLLGTPIPEHVLQALHPGKRRWRRLRKLLSREGTIASSRPKLNRWQTVRLDFLLDERRAWRWAWSLAFPPAEWMAEHFGRESREGGGGRGNRNPWKLYWKRARRMASRWRPE